MSQTLRLNSDIPQYVRRVLNQRIERTPDMREIMEEGDQLVFVYGTLKQGFGNHRVIDKDAAYLGKARTLNDGWLMYDTGGFPVVLPALTDRGDYIYGEVYSVPPSNMLKLDALEANGFMYERRRVKMKLMDQLIECDKMNGKVTALREAWLYVGVENYWNQGGLTKIEGQIPPLNDTQNYKAWMAQGLYYRSF